MLRAPCLLGAHDSVTRRTHHTLPSGETGPTLPPRLGLTIHTQRHIMKSYLKYLLACLGLLLLLPACKNESDVEEATIDVSTQLMTFTKDGGEQTLTVKTNKDTWTAFTTQESWLTSHRRAMRSRSRPAPMIVVSIAPLRSSSMLAEHSAVSLSRRVQLTALSR